jgi:hypothetical protein
MITGAHFIIYSANSKKDRDFFRDILKLTNVDVGEGWLIFGLPPSEVAVHPSSGNDLNELYLMCDDITKFMQAMAKYKILCSALQTQRWGLHTQLTLPGGGQIGVYQPSHARPDPMTIRMARKTKISSRAIKVVKKKSNRKNEKK